MFCMPALSVPGFRKQPAARKFTELPKHYTVDWTHVLGQGGFSTVYKGTHNTTRVPVAIKKIPRTSNSNNKLLKQEINASMKVKNHEFIVSLLDVFVASDVVILCLEFMTGDVLFKRIVQNGPLTEMEIKKHFRGISQAILHLHNNKVVHRDIKPENLMFSSHGADGETLKLADFGLSKILPEDGNTMQTFCGTPSYLSPEAWAVGSKDAGRASYSRMVDSWSLGVTIFVSVSGYHPFDPNGTCDLKQLRENIMNIKWGFDDPGWQGITSDLKMVLTGTICQEKQRWSMEKILQSNFFRTLERTVNVGNRNRLSNKKRVLTAAMKDLNISESSIKNIVAGKKAKVDTLKSDNSTDRKKSAGEELTQS
eukprot:augustus_masked-scaffold_1-processed-gene-23.6-mRNA-1 protein AED:0.16 eAED:0.17 QI:0/-1/0/1/-1/1/1/0/366